MERRFGIRNGNLHAHAELCHFICVGSKIQEIVFRCTPLMFHHGLEEEENPDP
jgi:hypothetical protein